MIYRNAHHAIRDANAEAPRCIGWNAAAVGWELYSATTGCPRHLTPELLCIAPGKIPLPLSEEGSMILREIVPASERLAA